MGKTFPTPLYPVTFPTVFCRICVVQDSASVTEDSTSENVCGQEDTPIQDSIPYNKTHNTVIGNGHDPFKLVELHREVGALKRPLSGASFERKKNQA